MSDNKSKPVNQQDKSYEFFANTKTNKKNLNMSVLSLFLPIIVLIFLYLENQLISLYEQKILLVIFCFVVFILVYYNYQEIKHITYYWERPIKLKGNFLYYLEKNDYTKIDLRDIETIKVYKKKKIVNLLEFKSSNGKVLNTVYLKGFSYAETNKLISKLKEANKRLYITS